MKFIIRSGLPIVFILYFFLNLLGSKVENNDSGKAFVLLTSLFAGMFVTFVAILWIISWIPNVIFPISVYFALVAIGYKIVD